VTQRLPRDLQARLTEAAAADRRSLNNMIVILLEQAMKAIE
jgi:hypothetical protein